MSNEQDRVASIVIVGFIAGIVVLIGVLVVIWNNPWLLLK